MKKALKTLFSRQTLYFIPLLGLAVLFAYHFNAPDLAFAQTDLITPTDNPTRIGDATGGDFRMLLLQFLNFFLGFLGLLAVLLVIYGGFLYMTAAGDDGKTENGKKVILYAVIGIIIILISFALVNTLINGLLVGTD
ncbi:MAG: hypothetical protein Q8P68_00440 [Candidatus Peregrinibacteria bacterium]|nr:hypothetical protein [Candidatus Peregrinibacteria bacterium]MDZ4245172.1 hypothetical protein [Candidatus Gracilibacteria bacterium]